MTDYASTQTTAANPSAPSTEGTQWYQDLSGQDFTTEMHAAIGGTPFTPIVSGGSGRPAAGLVWPH